MFTSMRFFGLVFCFQLAIYAVSPFLASPVCAAKYRLRNPNAHLILQRPRRAGARGGIETGVVNRAPIRRGGDSNLLKLLHNFEELLEHMDYHMEHEEEGSVEKRGDDEYPIWRQYKR